MHYHTPLHIKTAFEEVFKDLCAKIGRNLKLPTPKRKAQTYNGNTIPLLGTIETTKETKKRMLLATILVVKGNFGSRPLLTGTVALELCILALARKKH